MAPRDTERVDTPVWRSGMATLVRDGLELRYEVSGSGPALLLPQLNFSWPDLLDLGPG